MTKITPQNFRALVKMGEERVQSENVKRPRILDLRPVVAKFKKPEKKLKPLPKKIQELGATRERIAHALQDVGPESGSEIARLRMRIEELENDNHRLALKLKEVRPSAVVLIQALQRLAEIFEEIDVDEYELQIIAVPRRDGG